MVKRLLLAGVVVIGIVAVFWYTLSPAPSGKFDEWLAERTEAANTKAVSLKTQGDAEWWAQNFLVHIPSEYFGPTSVGVVTLASSGMTRERQYAGEDLHEILDSVKSLVQTLERVQSSIGVPNYEYYRDWLGRMNESVQRKIMPDRP